MSTHSTGTGAPREGSATEALGEAGTDVLFLGAAADQLLVATLLPLLKDE